MDENQKIIEHLAEITNLIKSPNYDDKMILFGLSKLDTGKINSYKDALKNVLELIEYNQGTSDIGFTDNLCSNEYNFLYLSPNPTLSPSSYLVGTSCNIPQINSNNYDNNNNNYDNNNNPIKNSANYPRNEGNDKIKNHQININYAQRIDKRNCNQNKNLLFPNNLINPQREPLNHHILLDQPILPSISTLQNNMERDHFKEKKYEEVLLCLDILSEKLDVLIQNFYKIPHQNLEEFNNVLNKEDIHSAIKEEVSLYTKNISNCSHVFFSSIEYLKLGFYFSYLKAEAYSSNVNYINYIKNVTGWERGVDTIQYYIKFYSIYCKIPCAIFLIGSHNYTSSFFFKKNGTSFIEIADYNGKLIQFLNTKQIPENIRFALPPIDTPFKDIHKEKKKRKITVSSSNKRNKIVK